MSIAPDPVPPVHVSLPPLAEWPAEMLSLPRTPAGWPVPWFVARPTTEGAPFDLRISSTQRFHHALRHRLCWVCGQALGTRNAVYVIGPMCVVNRVTSEPPCHYRCALFSARFCPFLARPHMVRRDLDPAGKVPPAGLMLDRNPGVAALYTARSYTLFNPADSGHPAARAGVLIQLGHPERVEWWAEGKPATRAQVEAAIESGVPALADLATQQGDAAYNELVRQLEAAYLLLPPAAPTEGA